MTSAGRCSSARANARVAQPALGEQRVRGDGAADREPGERERHRGPERRRAPLGGGREAPARGRARRRRARGRPPAARCRPRSPPPDPPRQPRREGVRLGRLVARTRSRPRWPLRPRPPFRSGSSGRAVGSGRVGAAGSAGAVTSAATVPRQRPRRGGRRGQDRLLGRRHVLREQAHEAAAEALALAGGGRLLLGVALRRLGRELVDVGEDRLAERVDRARVEPAGHARLDEAPPRERGSRGGRRRAARRGCGPRASRRGRGRRRSARPRPSSLAGSSIRSMKRPSARSIATRTTWPNSPSIGARVVGHLARDRDDDLVRQRRQHRAQDLPGVGRDRGVGAGRRRHLSRGYRIEPPADAEASDK